MVPEIQKFLIQGSELLASRRGDIETLLNYLDKNLIVLKERLNEENFERILTIIWESSAQTLAETIQYNIDVSILYFLFNFVLLTRIKFLFQ